MEKQETVFERINRKCEEAKKKLVLIPHPKRKHSSTEEPYMKEVSRGIMRRG